MTGGPTYEQWAYARRTGRSLERVASECDLYGHDYQVLETLERTDVLHRVPSEVFCSNPGCGLSWKVER